ncbi:major facilitator superfamily transporter [Phialemonium atrogriseum]|uniref:Major facilitator superfamily transporter n=1 Tax=Phialemonium atrogriseum TaxID=1093897 RepID=A0AAJ0CB98_9PEZI|nr:major facilitator superfamily transporter [Phialemonium atrogriseum]KAK1772054.1 major facilitator superfamily transporter [Phialemonium atrogriseum]
MSDDKIEQNRSEPAPMNWAAGKEEILQREIDADEALQVVTGYNADAIQLDAETERRLLRKIDRNLMPMMCLIYGLNFLDKTTISYASIMGLKEDLNLVGDNYQWLGSLFYFGYLGWEFPTTRLMQRLPLGKYSAFNVIMWGLVLALFAVTENFGGAVVIRLFLGIFEAAVTPSFALFTSQWYTKSEQGFRTSIWFCFNGFAQIFGGLVAYGFAHGASTYGFSIAPWKAIFVFTGVLTSIAGIVFLIVMPDNQLNARFLTKEERVLAVQRIKINEQGIGNKHFKWYQMKEAFLDPMVWAFVFFALVADIPNGGITNFFSQLIVSFGYTPEQSLLYGTPGGAVEIVSLLVCGYLGDRFGNRLLISTSGLMLAILGVILIVAVPLDMPAGRLVGYYLTQAGPTPFVALLSLISTNIAGWTKKTTVAAMYLVAYCVGNIIGPQTFRPKDAPQYRPAEITILVCWAACLVDILFIWWYYRRQNSKKALIRAEPSYTKLENHEFLDLTDKENAEFVYSL